MHWSRPLSRATCCQVDPDHPDNAPLLQFRNSESCEQLNAWISGRTAAALNLTGARFGAYWHALFAEHNEWLEQCSAARRRRFQAGLLKKTQTNAKEDRLDRKHRAAACVGLSWLSAKGSASCLGLASRPIMRVEVVAAGRVG